MNGERERESQKQRDIERETDTERQTQTEKEERVTIPEENVQGRWPPYGLRHAT